MVLEKIFLSFPHNKSMEANVSWAGVIWNHMDMVGRIYVRDQLLHTKYISCGSHGF